MPMNRHAHMLDLLRPGITRESEIAVFKNKRELTDEDYEMIIQSATAVIQAARTMQANWK